jgi:pyridoxal phosphate enzyme (YggS family)
LVDDLAGRLATVQREIGAAAARARRDPATIRIVAVTKTFPAETVRAALGAGLREIGENYVQEAAAKRRALPAGGCWHLIGGLQRNKVRVALAVFDCVQTVDRAEIADALAAEAARAGRRLPVLIQVNVAAETRKRGAAPDDLAPLAEHVLGLPDLRLEGLMTIAPIAANHADSRPFFRELRELRDRVATRLGVELPHLSMGMSNDFPIAVEEGATLLRLGRALFGGRGFGVSRPGVSGGGEGS